MIWFVIFIVCLVAGYNPAMRTLELAGHEQSFAGKIATAAAVACLAVVLLFALVGLI